MARVGQWRSIDLIVQTTEQVEALQVAVDQQWIEVSARLHSVSLTDARRRRAKR
jgi:hypothetical protein